MSFAHKRKCKEPLCTTLTDNGYYCDVHRPNKNLNRTRPAYRALYNSTWHKARKAFLAANPICRSCGVPAEVVDHIVAHRGDTKLFWDVNNWQPLCKWCHDKKTGRGE